MSAIASRPRAGSIVAVLVGLVLVAGCDPAPTQPAPSPVGDYVVTGYVNREGAFTGLVPGTRITLSVKADGTIAGSACNTYGARWRMEGGSRIRISDGFSTDMACPEPEGVMAQELDYLANLDGVTMWQREWQKLTLASGGGPNERGRPLITADALPPGGLTRHGQIATTP